MLSAISKLLNRITTFRLCIFVAALMLSSIVLSEESMSRCESVQHYIKGNFQDGVLITNKVSDFVPYVRTSFKYDGLNIRVPLYIVDIDSDGVYEIIYLIDIGSPAQTITKIYILDSLQKEQAIELIENKGKSAQYKILMDRIKSKYKWNALRDLVDYNPLSLPYENWFPEQVSYEKGMRITISQFESKGFFIVDNISSKKIAVVAVLDLNKQQYSQNCVLKY